MDALTVNLWQELKAQVLEPIASRTASFYVVGQNCRPENPPSLKWILIVLY